MYTTTTSFLWNNGDSDDVDSADAATIGLIVGVIVGIFLCIGKIAFWVWICHRCKRREQPVIIERNVVVQSNTTTPAPVQVMPPGAQYGMPPGAQYGMPPGAQYGNPPAYYPPGSYGPPQVPMDGAPRSVDVDPRVDVSQKNALVQNV